MEQAVTIPADYLSWGVAWKPFWEEWCGLPRHTEACAEGVSARLIAGPSAAPGLNFATEPAPRGEVLVLPHPFRLREPR
jgi:hypothetical protein